MEHDVYETNGNVLDEFISNSNEYFGQPSRVGDVPFESEIHLGEESAGQSSKLPPIASEKNDGVSVDEMERQTFSFETDYLALRNNTEYRSILKLLVLLEAQRITSVEHLNKLEDERRKALENPADFIKKLREGNLELPRRQHVPDVPQVDFSQYAISADYAPQTNSSVQSTRAAGGDSEPTTSGRVCESSGTSARQEKITKSETYNKPWSAEEQTKLVDLLIKFPPEPVEARRWKKIADELGNRTIKQVASRVQKYFIKLTKAGLEVPGRVPHIPKSSKKVRRVQSTLKTHKYYLSTFFPQHSPSVLMDDEPAEEVPVIKQEIVTEECSSCGKKLGSFFFRCEQCHNCRTFCSDESCQRDSSCGRAGHPIKMASDFQIDTDYVFENHYLDPNYLPS